jgi:hypothetical protein
MTWKQSGDGFVESDVLKWKEALWAPKRRRKQRHPWGEQEVTGQITAIDGDYISLKVMKAEITKSNVAADLKPHKVGAIIRKKRSTLLRGSTERLNWSEEDVRAALLLLT